jgi:hypothetical protein
MQAHAAGYALTNLSILKLSSSLGTVVSLTAAKFEPFVLPTHGSSLSSITCN